MMSPWSLLLVPVFLVCLVVRSGGNPTCDTALVGDMSKHYPRGVPKDLTSALMAHGPFSYILLSNESAQALPGQPAACVGFKLLATDSAVVTKKMEVGAISSSYAIEESEAVFDYVSATDIEIKYKIYTIYYKNGVLLTYRCCDSCPAEDADPSVGIAVADRLRRTVHTRLAVSEAFHKLRQLGLDHDLVELQYCSDILS